MAQGNFTHALDRVLAHEGGAVDNPKDPGGRTNFGITQSVYDVYRISKGLALSDVYKIATNERDEIYRKQYWDAVCGEALPAGLDYVLFDGAVNSGPGQSVKWLQRALSNVKVDGQIGNETLAAVEDCSDLLALIVNACEARREFLRHLRTFSIFGKGWSRRVNDVQGVALAWASGATLPSVAAATSAQAKATQESAVKPPSTLPGDVAAAVSGVGIATAAASKGDAVQGDQTSENPTVISAPANSQDVHSVSVDAPATSTTPDQVAADHPAAVTPSATVATAAASDVQTPSDVTAPSSATSTLTDAPHAAPSAASPSNPDAPSTSPSGTAGAPDAAATPTVTTSGAAGPNHSAPTLSSSSPAVPASSAANTAANSTASQTIPAASADSSSFLGSKIGGDIQAYAQQQISDIANANMQHPETFVGLAALLVSSLFISSSSRQARVRRADALGENASTKTVLKPGNQVKKVAVSAWQASSLPGAVASWGDWLKRISSVAWIAVTIGINALALAKMSQGLGLEQVNWQGPFIWLGQLYDAHASQAFDATSAAIIQNYGFTIPKWLSPLQQWIVPIFILYVSTASAIVFGSKGLLPKGIKAEDLMGKIGFKNLIFLIPTFVLDAVRYRVVTHFARQYTFLFLAYILVSISGYFGAVYINDHVDLPKDQQQLNDAAAKLMHEYEFVRTLIPAPRTQDSGQDSAPNNN